MAKSIVAIILHILQQILAATPSSSKEQDTSSPVLTGDAESICETSSHSHEDVYTTPYTIQSISIQVKPLHRNARIQSTPISKGKGALILCQLFFMLHAQLFKQLQECAMLPHSVINLNTDICAIT